MSITRVGRGVVSVVCFLAIWQWIGATGRVFGIVSFTDTVNSLWGALTDGSIISPTLGTLWIAALGFGAAVVIGIALGLVTGLSELAGRVLDPLIDGAYATPTAMFIPVIGVYAGLGTSGKVFLVFTFCVFPISMNTTAGVRQVSADHYALAEVLRLRRFDLYRKIVLPSAAPLILAGLRVSVGRAISGAIAADLLLSVDNLGAYLVNAAARFDLDRLLAASFFAALLGIATMSGARLLERRVLRWNYPNQGRRLRQTGFGRMSPSSQES
jgi:ABC-type nitrate/sulfonate/bicarbonate transport system permease component